MSWCLIYRIRSRVCSKSLTLVSFGYPIIKYPRKRSKLFRIFFFTSFSQSAISSDLVCVLFGWQRQSVSRREMWLGLAIIKLINRSINCHKMDYYAISLSQMEFWDGKSREVQITENFSLVRCYYFSVDFWTVCAHAIGTKLRMCRRVFICMKT